MTSGRFSGLAVGLVGEGRIVVLRDEGVGGLGRADSFLGFGDSRNYSESQRTEEDPTESIATADAGGVAAVGIIGHR
jgi:hypothetical protein